MIPYLSRAQLERADDPADFVRTLFSCDHPEVAATKRRTRAGGYQRVLQCQTCGGQLSHPMAENEKAPPVDGLPDFNHRLGEAWVRAETDGYDLARTVLQERHTLTGGPAFTPEYRAYLNSPEWRFRREAILRRDRHTCQACGQRRADLVAVCAFCHQPLHDRHTCQACGQRRADLVAVCAFCHQPLHDRPEP